MKILTGQFFFFIIALILVGCGASQNNPGGDGGIMLSDGGGNVDNHGLTWVSIPAGTYLMGCVPQDPVCTNDTYYDNEKPRHTVHVPTFQITATEITQSQYYAVMSQQPSSFSPCDDCPVESVHWSEARAFCQAVSGRLPSESEWEYAARAGTRTIYICGDDPSCLNDIAWYYFNSDGHTYPVGMNTANAFGLYDMTGNVQEWTEDCHHNGYTNAPGDGNAWTNDGGGPTVCEVHMLRGGDWSGHRGNDPKSLRASYRSATSDSRRSDGIGFRCAR